MYRRHFPNDPGFAESIDTARRVSAQATSPVTRVKENPIGVVVGIILLFAGSYCLYWNEGSSVASKSGFQECLDKVVPAPSEGHLVYVTGKLVTDSNLSDSVFGVSVAGAKLKRVVEMYQWEEESRSGDSHSEYRKKWSSSIINSNRYPHSNQNPNVFPIKSEEFNSEILNIDQYSLSNDFRVKISKWYEVDDVALMLRRDTMSLGYSLVGDYLYGPVAHAGIPKIGDFRIYWRVAGLNGNMASVIGWQSDSNLIGAYRTQSGNLISLFSMGELSAESLIHQAMMYSYFGTWGFRLLGWGCLMVALLMMCDVVVSLCLTSTVLQPFAHMVPLYSCFVLSGSLALLVIALSWLQFRPVMGVFLIVVISIVVCFHRLFPDSWMQQPSRDTRYTSNIRP